MDEPRYKITKDDVAIMLRHLRHAAPEHATPEKAVFLLEQQHVHYEEQQHVHYEKLEELHPDLI